MHANPRQSHLLSLSAVVTDMRWYYGTIAFLFGSLDGDGIALSSLPLDPIFIAFALYLLANAFIQFLLDDLVSRKRPMSVLPFVNQAQVWLDLLYVTIIIALSNADFPGIGQVLYFIPIITSTIFFGVVGALSVALCAGAATFALMLRQAGWSMGLADPSLVFPVTQAAIITAVYALAAFFGGSVARSIRIRDRLLTGKIEREGEHIRKLNTLAREFDTSAKLLVRRDLDLMKANRDLERIDQMKSEIISVVAHQLRTPLSAVKWTLKMLTDGDAGAMTSEQKMLMMKAYESNERMIGLVNDMLSADRLESGKFRYRFFPIQLEDLIENIVTEMLSKANERNVAVRFVRPQSPLPRVMIDPDKIRDVLQNLLDNAIKYSRRSGTVTIGLLKEGDESVRCSIVDQGIGIPATERDKIFSRFFRAQNALRAETDGSGLGLFIVRGIIQRHGGSIWFDSEEGKGTTMHVRLPIDPGHRESA